MPAAPGLRFVGGRFRRDVVRHIVAGPSFLLRIPPDPFFLFAPGFAVRIGRSAVVHDPAVGRPGPTPIQLRAGLAGRVGRASIGEILAHRGIDARVDPRRAGRRTIVFQLAEAGDSGGRDRRLKSR